MNTTYPVTRFLRKTTLVFLAAEVLDMTTTAYAFANYTAVEGNPIVNHIGWVSATLFKLAIIIGTAWFLEMDKPNILRKIDWIFPIVAAAPVIWNLFQLLKVIL
jgi:hypothetical protein